MSEAPEPALVMDAPAPDAPAPVLVVDMDGSLLRSDTLHEALIAFAAAEPWRIPALCGWLRLGKAGFKRRLANEMIVEAAGLPVNECVVELIGKARQEGRRVVLVSAADQRQVDAVAAHLGLFDEAHGTGSGALEASETGGSNRDGSNLGGHAKARFLVERFGEKGFDYVGDSRADLPVWAAARRAFTVCAPASLRAAAGRACREVEHLSPRVWLQDAAHYLWALRPHQWLKNLLVFLPLLAAHQPGAFGAALLAFVVFSMTASSVYLVNDLLDLAADRAHPRKRLRPFAAGAIPLAHGAVLAPMLAGTAALLALLFLPPRFLAVLALYYVSTFAYSLVLKRQLIVDVWMLGALYTLRLLAGGEATGIPLSFWMLGFSMFLFLALAAVKRQAELTDLLRSGREGAGRAYQPDDLPILQGIALAAGYASVIVLALYINSPGVVELYERPRLLWYVCPLLLYWISMMVMVTHRGRMTDDPIVFAVRDPASLVVLALTVLIVLVAGPL
jgi:4-hydroxybenzoate polyprenyltransferase/phosphoserine phosphatase